MFVGRQIELRKLSQMLDGERPEIAVIYGRRRVGKTELIRHAVKLHTNLFFEGSENQPKAEQLSVFLFQLQDLTGIKGPKSITKWREAFHLLTPYLKNHPTVIVLDEFQWMANYRKDIVSDLKLIWDLHWSRIPGVKLILCGSIASFMKDKVIKSSALYGRVQTMIHLKALSLGETRDLLGKGYEETLEAYLLLGGIPEYLHLMKTPDSIHQSIDRLAFKEDGYFHKEYERIFTSHFGRHPDYERIVRLLAEHSYGLQRSEIVKRGFVDGGLLTNHLNNLETAGFISSSIPIDKKPNSKLIRYELSDAYLRFYYAFINPNERQILAANPRDSLFHRIQASAAYRSWLGRSFEYLCIAHQGEISRQLGFSAVKYSCGPYFRSPRKNVAGVQIDLVYKRDDNVLMACEMKHHRDKVGVPVLKEMQRKESILIEMFPGKTVQSALIVAHGVTKELSQQLPARIVEASEFMKHPN